MLKLACFFFLTLKQPTKTELLTLWKALLSRNNTNSAFLSVHLFTSTSANMKTEPFSLENLSASGAVLKRR